MIQQELKKLAVYGFFLAILLIPMLGFKSTTFDPGRAFKTLGVFMAILVLNLILKAIRSQQKEEVVVQKMPLTERVAEQINRFPKIYTLGGLLAFAAIFPLFADNYMIDVGITCLIYVCLGLGLNIVVGLCGLLDLGYIAFYAVGAYTYSLLNLTFGLSFWSALPLGIVLGMIVGCIIGYPTLKMRGDYLAIVTLGFGEIVRLVLNNWDSQRSFRHETPGFVLSQLCRRWIRLGDLLSEILAGALLFHFSHCHLDNYRRQTVRQLAHRPRLDRHPRG